MKIKLPTVFSKLSLLALALFPLTGLAQDETDESGSITEVPQPRIVYSNLMFDFGASNVRDTYLTPLHYKGENLGVHYERFRRMRSEVLHNLQTIDLNFAKGEAENGRNSEMWAGRIRYRYAMHFFPICENNFDFFIGPYSGLELGYNYNLKLANGNNPATARFAFNAGASIFSTYNYRIGSRWCRADFLAQIPLIGTAFMPEYGQSYYETFLVNDEFRGMHFTSLHNQQDLDLRLSTLIPFSAIPWLKNVKSYLKVGGYYHIETMNINKITTRYSSAGITIGWAWRHLPL